MIVDTFHVGMPAIAVRVSVDEAERSVTVVPPDWASCRGVTAAQRRPVEQCLERALQAMHA